jgi:hypothetical protein
VAENIKAAGTSTIAAYKSSAAGTITQLCKVCFLLLTAMLVRRCAIAGSTTLQKEVFSQHLQEFAMELIVEAYANQVRVV